MVLFPSNHIKIMLKIIKLTLNINVERDLCSHHTVYSFVKRKKTLTMLREHGLSLTIA